MFIPGGGLEPSAQVFLTGFHVYSEMCAVVWALPTCMCPECTVPGLQRKQSTLPRWVGAGEISKYMVRDNCKNSCLNEWNGIGADWPCDQHSKRWSHTHPHAERWQIANLAFLSPVFLFLFDPFPRVKHNPVCLLCLAESPANADMNSTVSAQQYTRATRTSGCSPRFTLFGDVWNKMAAQ